MRKYLIKQMEKILDKFGYNLRRNYWINDAEFMAALQKVKSHTSLKADKLYFLFKFANYAKRLPGQAAEVGVYKGGSAKLIGIALKDTSKKIYIFDTFDGFSSLSLISSKQDPPKLKKGFLADTSLSEVKNYLKNLPNIKIIKGKFPQSIGDVPECFDLSFSLVYIDTDIYQSTLDCLDFFFPRISPGGVIICDDYNSKRWQGVTEAVDEFLSDKRGAILVQTTLNQALIIKSPIS